MTECRRLEPLLAERASGPLSSCDEVVLAGHLARCAPCRADLAAYREALALAQLPPRARPTRSAGLPDLASVTLAAWKRRGRRRPRASLLVAGFAAASVAAGIALTPVVLSRPRTSPAAAAAAAWEPEVDAALAASGVEVPDADLSPDDVALAALDEASP